MSYSDVGFVFHLKILKKISKSFNKFYSYIFYLFIYDDPTFNVSFTKSIKKSLDIKIKKGVPDYGSMVFMLDCTFLCVTWGHN